MQVRATNNKTVEKLSGETQVTINVVANNNPPYFNQRSYLATIRNDRPVGSHVIAVKVCHCSVSGPRRSS